MNIPDPQRTSFDRELDFAFSLNGVDSEVWQRPWAERGRESGGPGPVEPSPKSDRFVVQVATPTDLRGFLTRPSKTA